MATIWAFTGASDDETKKLIYDSVKSGKSRFGWSQDDKHNLKLKDDNWTDNHSKQLFLLQIKPGDWIVHINTPSFNCCIAARVTSEYDFDDGLKCNGGPDFRHYFNVDVGTIVEFDRNDRKVLPSVNLKPRSRFQRVYAFDDFMESIENIKKNVDNSGIEGSREEFYLKKKTNDYLPKITELIQSMHKSKNLEKYLAKVFEKIPGVENVLQNGLSGGTDHGADLIVTISNILGGLELEQRIIVQVKSFTDKHHENDFTAINQVKEGIKHYNGNAGMIITTAEENEGWEKEILKASEEVGVPIDSISSEDVAKFVIKYAPDLVFNL